jgi:hypothetical protein
VGNTELMNGHRLSELGEHESRADDGKLSVQQNSAPARGRTGVLNEEKPKIPSGKNKIKTPLTRPASLEMTHYPELCLILGWLWHKLSWIVPRVPSTRRRSRLESATERHQSRPAFLRRARQLTAQKA